MRSSATGHEGLYLRQLELGPMQNFVYLVGCARTREVAVIDPAWEVDRLLQAADEDGVRIAAAFVSHRHFDHTNGLPSLLERVEVPVFAHEADAAEIGLPPSAVRTVKGGDTWRLGDVTARFVHTPGHTQGSQSFLVDKSLFSGDTLFIRGCGRCDLPGGDPEQMFRTIKDVLGKLDAGTQLFPGHNYADKAVSTLGEERRDNPFLQFGDVPSFVAYRMAGQRPAP